MAAIPFMPLYVSDYLADTPHLSTAENGAYMLLIMTYWQRGKPLPVDDKKLARIARATPEEWAVLREEVMDLFTLDEGVYRHKRIDDELEKAAGKIEQAKRAGKASAASRYKRNGNARSTDVQREGQRNGNHTELDTDTEGNSKELPTRKPARKTYPDDFEAFWQAYPDRQGTSKAEAASEWQKLNADDKRLASDRLTQFKQWIARQGSDYRTLHACRYLSKRRWEGFEPAPPCAMSGYQIGLHHPARRDWIRHWEGKEREGDSAASMKLTWYVADKTVREDTEYPSGVTPTTQPKEAAE